MISVFKYPLMAADRQHIDVFEGAEILSAGYQLGQIVIWALVDTEKTKKPVAIRVYGTGHQVYPSLVGKLRFIDTVQVPGDLVFHVFEETTP